MNDATTTELDAVNIMLANIGQAPVDSLMSGLPEADIAYDTLKTVTKEVQSGEWDWNYEECIELRPTGDREILVPAGVLKIVAHDRFRNIVVRSGKLYDKDTHSDKFSHPLKVNITWMYSWGDIPETAKQYIYTRASRRFQKNFLGSETLDAFTKEDEVRALVALRTFDTAEGQYNILYDNYDVFRIIHR